MQAITSQHNQKLKQIRKLRQRKRWRERTGRFVAEGEDLLAAADAAGWPAVERYCVAGSGLPGVEVDAELLASASGLGSGTRTLAVYDERWAPAPTGPLCVYLHGVSDPGNVGTIMRSAAAFGASCLALGPATADPYSLKAVRGSMGAVFEVPLWRAPEAGDLGALPGAKIALVPGAGRPLAELWASAGQRGSSAAGSAEVTLLIGAERHGLAPELIAQADHVAHIPIATNSLNAAMAASIALYELANRMAADE